MEAQSNEKDKFLRSTEEAISLDEALQKTNFGKFNYFIVIVGGFVFTNYLVETTSVGFYMTVAHCDLELTDFRKGLLSSVPFLGIIFSSHLWGFLADTQGRKKVMAPTLLVGFLITLMSSFSVNFWMILVLRFLSGICVCGSSTTIYAYLGEFHVERIQSRTIMVSSFIFSFISIFYPLLSMAIINQDWSLYIPILNIVYKPWRLYIVAMGTLGLMAGLAMFFLPESPKYLLSVNREKDTIQVLETIYKINGGKDKFQVTMLKPEYDDMTFTTASKVQQRGNFVLNFFKTMWTQTVPLFQHKYLKPTLILCKTHFWICVIADGLYLWFPFIENALVDFMKSHPDENQPMCNIVYGHLNDLYSNNATVINECEQNVQLEDNTYFYSLIMEISYMSCFVILTLIINCVGKITLLFSIIIVSSSCGLVAVWLPYTSIAAIFYIYLFLVGVAINVLGSLTVDLYPTQMRAMAMGISSMFGSIGSVAGTNLVGALLSSNCEITFYLTCFSMILCAFLILFLPRAAKGDCDSTKNNNNTIEVEI